MAKATDLGDGVRMAVMAMLAEMERAAQEADRP